MITTQTAPPSVAQPATTRRLSGFKPTGRLQLGNYLGAIRPMVDSQRDHEPIVMIANLHALTVEHDPDRLREHTTRMLATLLAAGVDTARTTCYLQSDVPEHAELHYLLECATGYGEAARMIQFKEKSRGNATVRLSLLTYPVLMAADVLLHDTDEVPVGDDQTQHLELARDVANRFNTRYGRTFVVPRGVTPAVAARVMDLADPRSKMGKTATTDGGVIFLLDPADVIARKVARAVTDPAPDVAYDPDRRPGAANLLEILAALRPGTTPAGLAGEFSSYRQLKDEVAEALVETLRPLRARYDALMADHGHLEHVRRSGAAAARERAARTVARAKDAIGIP
ncbi:tryptophan--tRNA ligase [Luedemannella helvata]|uniref:Tryptophan--tRNA ligase n=1 Tax=Luedemannella helvata TaxID=349315 RepID=A0ABP4WLJ7_9ACTN